MSSCPKGHDSTDPDYCSECGMRLDPGPPPPSLPPRISTAPPVNAAVGEICPDCGTPRVGQSRYCEVCRYDFVPEADLKPTADVPPPPPQVPLPPPVLVPRPALEIPPQVTAPFTAGQQVAKLDAVVITDPSLVKEPLPATPCPLGAPDRVFPLDLTENLLGRRSESKGIFPEVDVADPGVSHRHLKFIRQSDGSFVALELGSANGTQLNGVELTPGVAAPVKAGDELLAGIWTRIQLRARTT